MSRPRVLFAHELAAFGRAVERVLDCHGFDVLWVQDGAGARERIAEGGIDAMVVDVALPDIPGHLLIEAAREAGIGAVLLVAAVYRKTSYKRRPRRLYGADDYVEVHHLGDHLPERLRRHLGLPAAPIDAAEARRAHEWLEATGDTRLRNAPGERVAELLVADLLLYNGDLFALEDAAGVRRALDQQVGALVELFRQLRPELDDGDTMLRRALDDIIDTTHAAG